MRGVRSGAAVRHAAKDLAERERVWAGFMSDQEWLKARAETEKNGAIVANIASKILAPTAYSKLK